MDSSTLTNRVVMITGGGTGIGAAIAREVARAGASVAIMGRRRAALEVTAEAVQQAGGRCLAIQGDVRRNDQVEHAVAATIKEYGRLDVLVPNAALADHDPIDKADPGLWEALLATNVLGVMLAVRACLPHMYLAADGHIVIVASASGRTTYVGEPAYITSKHAIVAFGDCLRKEAAGRGVRVTVLEPGVVDTPFVDWDVVRDRLPGVEPLRPEDCARVVRFALEQPPNSVLNEIVIRPAGQAL